MKVISLFWCVALLARQLPVAAQSTFSGDPDIKAFLHENFDGKNVGMVVGLADEHGSRIFGAGRPDNGTSQEVDGDTVFEIGSITKTFTTLLLQDMVGRGEMKMDDPVSKYLPDSVKMPTRNGRQITLLNLAAQDSGLPFNPGNLSSGKNPFADYTAEKLYAFLSCYTLTNEPGKKFEYSNLGMGLLGHVIALKADTNYESLVVDRICKPLHMDSTGITLTPELKARLAKGHNASGKSVPNWDFDALAGCGALHSTANDLLKYVSAEIGQSSLTPLMEKTQVIRHTNASGLNGLPMIFGNTAIPWVDEGQSAQTGMELLGHAGGTGGYSAFIGFDRQHRRGVVVLFNQQDGAQGRVNSRKLGWLLLEGVRLTPQITSNLFPANMGDLAGIGVSLGFDQPTRTLRVDAVLPNTPASQAGLTAGLMVLKIDDIPTAGKSTDLCACYIRGKAGTKVQLELVNPERKETNTVELTRQKFTLPKQ
ncbi:MAG TPA: serine hydrolase [Candidatus Cybelea sp.]|jgi:CubicO group peptidase (beta-lactamase class C family)|nr:serine hydrolase [Candidatus Cybelea sp.]